MKNDPFIQEIAEYKFKDYFDSRFCRIYYNEPLKISICELKSDYVPIEHFKDSLYKVSNIIKEGINHKFIFDKRSLQGFHQPSMEWYFIKWKPEMMELGLYIHRKILPSKPWFEKCVKIARQEILNDHPDNILHKLDIKYCRTMKEAIET